MENYTKLDIRNYYKFSWFFITIIFSPCTIRWGNGDGAQKQKRTSPNIKCRMPALIFH